MRAETPSGGAPIALLPLLIGVGIMLGLSVYPPMLQRADGRVDHWALCLLCWAMSAGLTRGVGLIPRHPVLRLLLSGTASVLALLAAIALRMQGG